MAPWDTTKIHSQLRLTSYNLAQLQDRHHQTSSITKHDVAALIRQAEISAARRKTEKLIQDDRFSVLIERLEFYCNLLLERFPEVCQTIDIESDSPVLEAVRTLMFVAPQIGLRDVMILRDMLVQIYGLELYRLVIQDYVNRIPSQIVDTLDGRPPSVTQVDAYMGAIAEEFDVNWSAPLLPKQRASALSKILDQNAFPRMVDLEELRKICLQGVPLQPPWLRPRVWKLLLGTLSPQKDFWEVDAHSKRQSYYDLARPLLHRLNTQSRPKTPLSTLDASLSSLAKSLTTLPPELDVDLDLSPLCPFDEVAPEGLKIEVAGAVDERVRLIQEHDSDANNGPNAASELRLKSANMPSLPMPQISVSSPTSVSKDDINPEASIRTIHSQITRNHTTSLLRLMYIHMALHPSASTVYLTSLVIPLYVTMIQEIEPAELAHVEADTFWLLTELWGDVGELVEDQEGRAWMSKFGQRLAWADAELSEYLMRKGLDPSMPHYSYRWLAPLLTRTLPFPSILIIWDALFTQTTRTSDQNAKLEFFLDICTGMLINARIKLFRLDKANSRSPGLWGDVDMAIATPSLTVDPEEVFIQGMILLQAYPVNELGGTERIIEIAADLQQRNYLERKAFRTPGLGEQLRGKVWSKFIAKAVPAEPPIPESNESEGTPSPEWPDSGAEGEDDVTETTGSALLGRLGSTVWRGITNQSSMDVPTSPLIHGSPIHPLSPASSSVILPSSPTSVARIGSRLGNSIWRGFTNQSAMDAPPSPVESSMHSSRPEFEDPASPLPKSSFWSYTGKLRDSDAAASLAKTSTNWTARASTLWQTSPSSTVSSPEFTTHRTRPDSLGTSSKTWTDVLPRRGSLPSNYKDYFPPPRPNFRESRYFPPGGYSVTSSPSMSAVALPSTPALLAKGKSSLASLTSSAKSTPKSVPRPLLLSSSSLITPSNPRRSTRSPAPVAPSSCSRDSMSSASSTSAPLSVARQSASERDSETGDGRLVPLRRTISSRPLRTPSLGVTRQNTKERPKKQLSSRNEQGSLDESFSSTERRASSGESATRGWGRVELPDSPSTLFSTPPPKTPTTLMGSSDIHINGNTDRPTVSGACRGVVTVPVPDKGPGRKKSWNGGSGPPASPLEATSDSSTSQDNPPPIRSKRYGQRPINLRLKSSDGDLNRSSQAGMIHVETRNISDSASLAPDSLSDVTANTPRANEFPSPNSPGRAARIQKDSRSPRRAQRKGDLPAKGSGGEEGDDEGYDDFLSAYESEDGAQAVAG
ncbi:hypothetical protein K439DRAFT_1636664 [Ramaria rubella]|nr:hypothetical protein K439DRAFT_1636664 [Ramaria rubella]